MADLKAPESSFSKLPKRHKMQSNNSMDMNSTVDILTSRRIGLQVLHLARTLVEVMAEAEDLDVVVTVVEDMDSEVVSWVVDVVDMVAEVMEEVDTVVEDMQEEEDMEGVDMAGVAEVEEDMLMVVDMEAIVNQFLLTTSLIMLLAAESLQQRFSFQMYYLLLRMQS
jgi:hypothetical protein